MISFYRFILCLGLTCFLNFQVFAEAPVVDDSENFALLDNKQAAVEQPVSQNKWAEVDNAEEIALAQDNPDSNNTNAELLDKLHGMQQEIQELRGQLEVQSHELKLLKQQQLAFYKDLDARIQQDPRKQTQASINKTPENSVGLSIESTPLSNPENKITSSVQTKNDVVVEHPTNSTSRANPAEEQISYLAAYELVKNKQFDKALLSMQSFVNKYPSGGYTANAHYWLGELYLVKNNYKNAIEHFDIVLKQFPSSTKAAASTLKIGYALAASGKVEEARMRLQQVMKNYPDTPTAQLAVTKLESLGVS